MLINLKCRECDSTFEANYGSYYSCSEHQWSHKAVFCPRCYQSGHGQSVECAQPMHFHDGKRTEKWARDNGIMF